MLDNGKACTSFCWVLHRFNQDLSSELSSLIQSWCNQAWWMLCWEDEDVWWFFVSTKWIQISVSSSEPWAPNSFPHMPRFLQWAVGSSTPAGGQSPNLQAEAKYENGNISHTAGVFDCFMDATLSMLLVETHAVHIAWSRLKMESYIRFGFLDVNLQVANWVSLHLIVNRLSCPKPMGRKASCKHSRGSNRQLYFPLKKRLFCKRFSKGASMISTEQQQTWQRAARRCEEVRMIPLCFFFE